MISNLSLLFFAIAKVALLTGVGPGIAIAAVLSRGRAYRVTTYWLGRYDRFIGRCTQVRQYRAEFCVLDPGPPPRVPNKCPFPECVREEHGVGEHEFGRIRIGGLIAVVLKYSTFDEEPSSGGGQLATFTGLIPDRSNRATSPPRKVRHA